MQNYTERLRNIYYIAHIATYNNGRVETIYIST